MVFSEKDIDYPDRAQPTTDDAVEGEERQGDPGGAPLVDRRVFVDEQGDDHAAPEGEQQIQSRVDPPGGHQAR